NPAPPRPPILRPRAKWITIMRSASAALAAAFTLAALPVPAAAAAPAIPTARQGGLLAGTLAAPPAPQPGLQTFGVQPAGPAGPDARPWFSYSATPGAALSDHIAVRNYGQQPLRLKVYAADGFNSSDGGFDVGVATRKRIDVGAWVRLDTGSVTVPAGHLVTVPFRLTIPA